MRLNFYTRHPRRRIARFRRASGGRSRSNGGEIVGGQRDIRRAGTVAHRFTTLATWDRHDLSIVRLICFPLGEFFFKLALSPMVEFLIFALRFD